MNGYWKKMNTGIGRFYCFKKRNPQLFLKITFFVDGVRIYEKRSKLEVSKWREKSKGEKGLWSGESDVVA